MFNAIRQSAAQIVLNSSITRLLAIIVFALVFGPNAPIGGGGGVG